MVVPSTVSRIGCKVFSRCVSLEKVDISGKVTYLGSELFYLCERLRDVILSPETKELKYQVFTGCKSLQKIDIPEKVTDLGDLLFFGCINLSEVNIPKGVTYIGNHAFCGCRITQLDIPDGVKILHRNVFQDCDELEKVIFPKSLETIGSECFSGCKKLKKVNLPRDLLTIGTGAFMFSGIEKVTMFSRVFSIEEKAFPWKTKNIRVTVKKIDLTCTCKIFSVYGLWDGYIQLVGDNNTVFKKVKHDDVFHQTSLLDEYNKSKNIFSFGRLQFSTKSKYFFCRESKLFLRNIFLSNNRRKEKGDVFLNTDCLLTILGYLQEHQTIYLDH